MGNVEVIITVDGKETKLYIDREKIPVTIEIRDEKNIIYQSQINTNIKNETEIWDTTETANEKDGNIPKSLVFKITNANSMEDLQRIVAENPQFKDYKTFKYYVEKRTHEFKYMESEKTDNGFLPKWLFAQLKNAKSIDELQQITNKNKQFSNRQIFKSIYNERLRIINYTPDPNRSEWD